MWYLRIAGLVLVIGWAIFTEWRITFLYRCMWNTANQLLLQNDINEQLFDDKDHKSE